MSNKILSLFVTSKRNNFELLKEDKELHSSQKIDFL